MNANTLSVARKWAGFLIISTIPYINAGCGWNSQTKTAIVLHTAVVPALPDTSSHAKSENRPAHPAVIMSRTQVPILCYHHIRDWRPADSKRVRDYIVPVNTFREQIKMLADNGYHTILPDQLYDYLTQGKSLPSKPVMLTFDDTDLEQYTVGLTEMNKYGFKGVFFIMTVSLDRPNYMTREEVKTLSGEGHIVGSHTWDHHNVKQYKTGDWVTQIDKPTRQLEGITGKPVHYFAYPFGLWNEEAITELKKRGFAAAFQLSAKRDEHEPLYTIRRMIVPGSWTPAVLETLMKRNFK